MLVSGQIRDPRLQSSAMISVTAVQVSGDLSQARVFVDVLDRGAAIPPILAALRSSAGLIRSRLGQVFRAKRVPKLFFEYDDSVERGERIEGILAELREKDASQASADDEDAGAQGEASGDDQKAGSVDDPASS